jgi:hypothetical protein
MSLKRTRLSVCFSLLAATLAIVVAGTRETSGYVLSGPTWAPGPVLYFVNTTNLDLPDAVFRPLSPWARMHGPHRPMHRSIFNTPEPAR